MKEASASNDDDLAAAALAAADDARLRARARAIVEMVVGTLLIVGSLLLWPRGMFSLITTAAIDSLVLIALGVVACAGGVLLVVDSAHRVTRLRHTHNSVGKAHEAFVNEPDYGMPAIGMGHGSPMDSSVAKFANPAKLMPGRSQEPRRR